MVINNVPNVQRIPTAHRSENRNLIPEASLQFQGVAFAASVSGKSQPTLLVRFQHIQPALKGDEILLHPVDEARQVPAQQSEVCRVGSAVKKLKSILDVAGLNTVDEIDQVVCGVELPLLANLRPQVVDV